MGKIFKWLLYAWLLGIVMLPLAVLALAWYTIEAEPAVNRAAQITPAHVERAKRLLERNDPRKMRAGMLRTITLSQEDLDLALNYLATRQLKGSSQLTLAEGTGTLNASVPMPTNPFGRYLNVSLTLRDTGAKPKVEHLRLGRLTVPEPIADVLLKLGLNWLQQNPGYAATDSIRRVQVSPQMLRVEYMWSDALPDQLRAALSQPGEQERMQAYQTRLVQLAAPGANRAGNGNGKQAMPLNTLLQPLLELAAQRASPTDPDRRLALEHRAALVTLAFYINGKGLAAVVPAAAQWPQPVMRPVNLGGRGDFAQHFSVSAALAATAGTPLADAVGIYKEIDDSRGGSGFSFNDIAADRSGTRFGELATGTTAQQDKLRRRLALGLTDQDLLPQVKDLPEFMQEAEFKRRYGGVDAPAYKKMQAEIEQRIGALPLYR